MDYACHTMSIILKKEGNPDVCDNIDELGRSYAQWNESSTEGQEWSNTILWRTLRENYLSSSRPER